MIGVDTKDRTATAVVEDNFYPEKYELIDDEKIARLKAIRANTSHPVAVRMFVCQNWKGQPQNYCDHLSDPQAEKKICESNKTDHVFFYVEKSEHEHSKNKPVDPVYMVAFARYPKTGEEIHKKIVAEVKKTAEWLGVAGSVIQCYVFYYATGFLCNTTDWGTFKQKCNEQCRDQKYIYQLQYLPLDEKKPRWLNINGGLPRFTIQIQEM
jgi:hypothetical protein